MSLGTCIDTNSANVIANFNSTNENHHANNEYMLCENHIVTKTINRAVLVRFY